MRNKLILLFLVIATLGCNTLKTDVEDRNKDFIAALPESYSTPTLQHHNITNGVWSIFESDELNNFIQIGFTNNLTLAAAWAGLRQAESLSSKLNSEKYPQLTLGADGSYIDKKNGVDDHESYGTSLATAYEIDLWGKIRAAAKSQSILTAASAEDINATALLLAANITETWLNIKAANETLRLLEEQVASNQKTLDLLKSRWKVSLTAAVDVFQQEQTLAQSKSLIPLTQQSLEIYEQQLAYLLGFPPQQKFEIKNDGLPELPELPVGGIPSSLLENRPDIRAAWLRVQSQDWAVAAAKANRLPSISLTGSFSYNDTDIDNLFDNWVLNLVGSLTAPLIDGGNRKAEVRYQEALTDEAFINYKDTVLTAMQEVENYLTIDTHQQKYLTNIKQQKTYADKTLTEAAQRYRNGVTDYLPVITALISKQSLERSIIAIEQDILINRVNLYTALGGNKQLIQTSNK